MLEIFDKLTDMARMLFIFNNVKTDISVSLDIQHSVGKMFCVDTNSIASMYGHSIWVKYPYILSFFLNIKNNFSKLHSATLVDTLSNNERLFTKRLIATLNHVICTAQCTVIVFYRLYNLGGRETTTMLKDNFRVKYCFQLYFKILHCTIFYSIMHSLFWQKKCF